MARSRRLGIAGEVSVWQIPENSVNHARVTSGATFFFFGRNIFGAQEFFERKIFERNNLDGRFPYGKNDQ